MNVVCRNYDDDRVIPRFARYLGDHLGWIVSKRPDPAAGSGRAQAADVIYLSGYFEAQLLKPWPEVPVAAYFTHREVEPPGNGKQKLYDRLAARVSLRVATCALYADPLAAYGPTAQIVPPVERGRFTPPQSPPGRGGMVAGFSGYTYRNRRKGEDLAGAVVGSEAGRRCEWRASGRGWPVPTRRYKWSEMPGFYQSLDVLVVTSRVEGVPMPPLEALACGVSVVIPRGVGLLDDLPELPGIHRYKAGSAQGCTRALAAALAARPDVDREALRAATAAYTITAWCEQHRAAFEEAFLWT